MRSVVSTLKKAAPHIYLRGLADCDEIGSRYLREAPAARVLLDLGCGDGEKTLRWSHAARAERAIGLEFVDDDVRAARDRGIDARKADLSERWPVADGECDVVVSSQNIEHMHRTLFYVSEMSRVLRPGGRAIVLTENLAGWSNVAALVFGWQPFSLAPLDGAIVGCPLAHLADVERTRLTLLGAAEEAGVVGAGSHVCVLAYRALRDVMERRGFRVLRYGASGYAPFAGWPSRIMCRIDPRHAHFLALEALKPQSGTA